MTPSNEAQYRQPGHVTELPRPLGSGLRWAIVALTVVSTSVFGLYLSLLIAPFFSTPLKPYDMQAFHRIFALAGAYMVTLLLHAALAVAWVYRAWSWLPPEQRWGKGWRSVQPLSPAMAAGFLLIPYFNLYWGFVIGGGIADALERMRVAYPSSRAIVPHRLATIAAVCTIVFTVFLQIPLIAALPWILFMARVEAVTRDFASERFPHVRPS